jgi:hypothetical protein|eukprot:CAMPEP_0173150874 /NCGR_PEP_ID=MMETSP1105-20130129/11230_1 /TAXON_ID=2985 /ORGANISM="Ochromonas sp., Strain BG-1" /LENGTH=53 /DNA_ID=CAMNT_0014066113 /DNA_START=332 /DNA_END=493 /DNA_ORIENTATION=-
MKAVQKAGLKVAARVEKMADPSGDHSVDDLAERWAAYSVEMMAVRRVALSVVY